MKKMFVEMGNDVFTSNFLLEQQDANYIEVSKITYTNDPCFAMLILTYRRILSKSR